MNATVIRSLGGAFSSVPRAVAGMIAGLGLTVALFVAGEAFPLKNDLTASFQGPAKMGAVLSIFAALFAAILGKILRVKDGGNDK